MALPGLGTAIGAIGGSLISGLFGSKSQSRAEKFERNRIQYTVADARKAGINPLAALGTAGMYENPYTGRSPGGGIGDAVAKAGKSFDDRQIQQSQIAIAESEVMRNRAEAEALAAEARASTIDSQARALGVGATTGGVINNPDHTNTGGLFSNPTPGVRTPFGRLTNANTSDAQAIEDRYGDPAAWIGGAANFPVDLIATALEALRNPKKPYDPEKPYVPRRWK